MAELESLGTPSLFVPIDMVEEGAPEAIVDACAERFGRVDGLANIAALTCRAALFSDTPDHFDRMMRINLRAPYFLIRAAARLTIAQGITGPDDTVWP